MFGFTTRIQVLNHKKKLTNGEEQAIITMYNNTSKFESMISQLEANYTAVKDKNTLLKGSTVTTRKQKLKNESADLMLGLHLKLIELNKAYDSMKSLGEKTEFMEAFKLTLTTGKLIMDEAIKLQNAKS